MLTEQEALAQILQAIGQLAPRRIPLRLALDEFAARDVFATMPLPVFDNSAMDGYAVVAASCTGKATQTIVGEQPAGLDLGLQIKAGEAVRVYTGAPVPRGADAVVMQEDVDALESRIFIKTEVERDQFIRRRGSDLSAGQKILEAGEKIRAQTLALLASQGLAEIDVGGEVRVAIVTTGDELVPQGKALAAGQIYESNSVLVRALLENCGATIARLEHCPDDAASIEAALQRALQSDVVIMIGGVSVGARDLVKPALKAVGAKTELWRVAVKPGKPFLFGRLGRCAIFALPGNPVSAFVTFLLFVRPAILKLRSAGMQALSLPKYEAELSREIQNASDRPHYVRGWLGDGKFSVVGAQESHALYGLSRANALLRLEPGEKLPRAATVSVLALD